MSKFKQGLVEDIKQDFAFKEQQEQLKSKYNVKDTDEKVVVVEKSNTYKFTLKMLVALIKTIATVILLILACIGLTTLVYPTTRTSFIVVMQDIYQQLKILLPFI